MKPPIHTRSTMFASCVLGFVLSSCATLKLPNSTSVDAKAETVLKRLSNSLADAHSFSFSGNRDVDASLVPDKNVIRNAKIRGTVQRPGSYAGTVSDSTSVRTIACDGNTLTIHDSNGNVYGEVAARPTLNRTLDSLISDWAVKPPMAPFLRSNFYDEVTSVGGKWEWIGVESVGGTSCDHLRLTIDVGTGDLWVAKANGLPRQLTITYATLPGKPQIRVRNLKWNLNVKTFPSQFKPNLPKGATKVEMIPVN